MKFDSYSNSEIIDAINSVISNKHDQYIIYSRLICGKTWHDLFIFSKGSNRHYERLSCYERLPLKVYKKYERLCLKVFKKLEEKTNDDG